MVKQKLGPWKPTKTTFTQTNWWLAIVLPQGQARKGKDVILDMINMRNGSNLVKLHSKDKWNNSKI